MPHYKQSVSQNNRPSSKSSCRGLNGTLTRFYTLSDLVPSARADRFTIQFIQTASQTLNCVWFTGQWAIFSHWWIKASSKFWIERITKQISNNYSSHIWKDNMCDSSFSCSGMSQKLRARLTSRISSTKASENPLCPQRILCVHERAKHDIPWKLWICFRLTFFFF